MKISETGAASAPIPTASPTGAVLPISEAGATATNLDLPLLGMHCSACAARIERALGKAVGV